MKRSKESRQHHWWPVGLQRKWRDSSGRVSWIQPNGETVHKKVDNRKIGYRRYGHTIFRDSVWKTNFEDLFKIDNKVPEIVDKLGAIGGDRGNSCQFHQLEENLHRNLLLFLYSILIRSPAYRSKYGNPAFPDNEDIGKANIYQSYKTAKALCNTGSISNQFFVFLRSSTKKFIFGDGSLDWLTCNLFANQILGKTLIPLTPELCIYFCTPLIMTTKPNCAVLNTEPWMVEKINDITQIYSSNQLFYLGKAPKLTDLFRKERFLEHKEQSEPFIDFLDKIAGNRTPDLKSINAFR